MGSLLGSVSPVDSAWEEVVSQPPEFNMCFQLPGTLFLMIWTPKFLCTAVFQMWLHLMAWDFFFSLLPEVLVPTITFLSKEETLQTPHETLQLQLAHDGAAISYAEIDMQVVNSFENSLE